MKVLLLEGIRGGISTVFGVGTDRKALETLAVNQAYEMGQSLPVFEETDEHGCSCTYDYLRTPGYRYCWQIRPVPWYGSIDLGESPEKQLWSNFCGRNAINHRRIMMRKYQELVDKYRIDIEHILALRKRANATLAKMPQVEDFEDGYDFLDACRDVQEANDQERLLLYRIRNEYKGCPFRRTQEKGLAGFLRESGLGDPKE